jgi:hypothetical protein
MILVRDIFRVKFGRMKEARAVLAKALPALKKEGYAPERLLVDTAGPFYTLVMESTYKSLADYEKATERVRTSAKWEQAYAKFSALVDSGSREIFTIIP